MNICIACHNKSKQFNQYCYNCNVPIQNELIFIDMPFNVSTYDNLQDNNIKKKYFDRHYTNIIKLFANNTNFKILPVSSQHMRVSILNSLLREFDLTVIFLKYNCYDPNVVSYMMKHDDMKYIINEKHDKYKLLDLYGSIIMDPWNCHDDTIKELYGNNGHIPNTIVEIMQLWYNNKLITQKKLDDVALSQCRCGNYIRLQDLELQKTPQIPTTHKSCLDDNLLDSLCDAMNGKIALNNTNIMDD
jgi:hypothetical protein